MRINGFFNKRTLQLLIDSGSTHNFIDEDTVKKLGCRIEAIKPMTVAVADGNKVCVTHLCMNFTWKIQNTLFTSDCMVLPLGCCDMVLGIQWISTLGPIIWDFQKLRMEFMVEGKKHVLRGASNARMKVISDTHLDKLVLLGGQLALIHLIYTEPDLMTTVPPTFFFIEATTEIPSKIQHLLAEYSDIFA